MRNLLIIILGLFFADGSCHSAKDAALIDGIRWRLHTLNGVEVKLGDENDEMFIQFNTAEKQVSGRAACNNFFGNYELDRDKLKFYPMGATRMTCPDIRLEYEFFAMLETVDDYAVRDDELSFFSKGVPVALFQKAE